MLHGLCNFAWLLVVASCDNPLPLSFDVNQEIGMMVKTCQFSWMPFDKERCNNADKYAVPGSHGGNHGNCAKRCTPLHWNFGGTWPTTCNETVDLSKVLQLGKCQKSNISGTWHSIMVGPLHSKGGDWHQISMFDDALLLSTGVTMTAYYMGMVSRTGVLYGYPPFHSHHVELHSYGGKPEPVAITDGSTQCAGHNGALRLGQGLPPGFCLETYDPFYLDAQTNDVRAFHAPSLEVWQLVAVFAPTDVRHLTRLSSHYAFNPGGMSFPMWIPRFEETFHFYTGGMPLDGKLVLATFATHELMLRQSFLLKGSPLQLGIDRFDFTNPCAAIATRSTKFAANAAFIAHVESTFSDVTVCTSRGQMEARDGTANAIEGFAYDRCPQVQCQLPWSFYRKAAFTVLSFHQGNQLAGSSQASSPWFPIHTIWNMYYISWDGQSHYTWQVYSPQEHTSGLLFSDLDYYTALYANYTFDCPNRRSVELLGGAVLAYLRTHPIACGVAATWQALNLSSLLSRKHMASITMLLSSFVGVLQLVYTLDHTFSFVNAHDARFFAAKSVASIFALRVATTSLCIASLVTLQRTCLCNKSALL